MKPVYLILIVLVFGALLWLSLYGYLYLLSQYPDMQLYFSAILILIVMGAVFLISVYIRNKRGL